MDEDTLLFLNAVAKGRVYDKDAPLPLRPRAAGAKSKAKPDKRAKAARVLEILDDLKRK